MTKDKLLSIYKINAKPAGDCFDAVEKALTEQGICTPLTLLGAMATVRVEVGKTFKPVREKLNYTAADLMRVFPKYFPTLAIAKQYAGNPVAIANKAYANRLGNGDEKSGDGYRYRGANFLQHTGKANWKEIGMTEENCLTYEIGAKGLAYYFKSRKVNIACNNKDWVKVRKLVNGGTNGLTEFLQVVSTFL